MRYNRNTMFWISIATATLCLLISIIIFSLRIGFPYHRGIGVGVYLLGWIPFMYSLFLVEGWILKGGGVMSNFSSPLIGELIFLILLFVVMYGIYKIFLEEKPNIILDQPDDIQQTLIEDQFTLEYLDKRFGELISIIEARSIFTNDFMDVLSEDKDSLRSVWSEYLDTVFEIELIYNKYASLRIWDTIRGRGIYSRVFINKYSALVGLDKKSKR
mgnify:CR=1 FL=1